MVGTRQTVLHAVASHPINSRGARGAGSRKQQSPSAGGVAQQPTATRSMSPRKKGRESTASATSGPRHGVVSNGVKFGSFKTGGEKGEEGELENENSMLLWKVQQLQATGEEYRQKVEALYVESQRSKEAVKVKIEDCKKKRGLCDEAALQTAAELAMMNSLKETLDVSHAQLRGVHVKTASKLSESRENLKLKSMDVSLREAELAKLNQTHFSNSTRIEELEAALHDVRHRRSSLHKRTTSHRQQQTTLTTEATYLTSDLQDWSSATDRLTAEARSIVGALDEAILDCTNLNQSCEGVREGSASPWRGGSKSPRNRSEEDALRMVNKELAAEASRVKSEADAKLAEAASREQQWASLCSEWETREQSREAQWKANLNNILFSEGDDTEGGDG